MAEPLLLIRMEVILHKNISLELDLLTTASKLYMKNLLGILLYQSSSDESTSLVNQQYSALLINVCHLHYQAK
jgi:hypothetical protein